MPYLRQHLPLRRGVAAQSVGDEALRLVFEAGEQALEEALGCRGVPAVLDQDIEHHPAPVDGAPEVVQFTPDAQQNLVEVPGVARPWPPAPQPRREVLAELQASAPDALVRDGDAAFRQDELDNSQAEPMSDVEHGRR
jgi:hypothetical protein